MSDYTPKQQVDKERGRVSRATAGFFQKPGHMKKDCPELDKVVAARRAAGLSTPRGVKGNDKGKGVGYSSA